MDCSEQYEFQVNLQIKLCSPATTPENSLDDPQVLGIATVFEGSKTQIY
jgi:hypothetical protein